MEVLFYNDSHLPALIEFIRTVWDKNASADAFLRKRREDYSENPYGAEGDFPIVILIEDNKIVGHIAATPCKLWARQAEVLMYWLSGLYLLPECRGGGSGYLLPKKLIDNLSVVTGFFVLEAPLKIYRKLGWVIVGKIPEYIKIINPRGFFTKIDITALDRLPKGLMKSILEILLDRRFLGPTVFSSMVNLYNSLWKLFTLNRHLGMSVKIVEDFDERVDMLWERTKYLLKYSQVRRSAYLNWRFKSNKGWTKVICEDGGRVLGYAIISVKVFTEKERLPGIKVVSIIDLLWDFEKPRVLEKLLHFVEKLAREKEGDILLCSVNSRNARNILLRNAFLRIPGTVHFAFHCLDNKLSLSHKMDEWFITRGDADAAGSLGPE